MRLLTLVLTATVDYQTTVRARVWITNYTQHFNGDYHLSMPEQISGCFKNAAQKVYLALLAVYGIESTEPKIDNDIAVLLFVRNNIGYNKGVLLSSH